MSVMEMYGGFGVRGNGVWSPEILGGRDPSRPYISVIKGRLNDVGPWQHDFCLIATLLH